MKNILNLQCPPSEKMLSKKLHSKLPYFCRRRFSQFQTLQFLYIALVVVCGLALCVTAIIMYSSEYNRYQEKLMKEAEALLRRQKELQLSDQKKIIEDAEKIPVEEEKSSKISESNQNRLSGRKVGKILGVKSEDLRFYIPDSNNMFACRSTGEKILFSKVNDDYCDCEDDGSDEPSTGACSDSVFHCSTKSFFFKGVFKASIPGSRINDGICDCCDGSDEWKSTDFFNYNGLPEDVQEKLGRYQSPCPNKCNS